MRKALFRCGRICSDGGLAAPALFSRRRGDRRDIASRKTAPRNIDGRNVCRRNTDRRVVSRFHRFASRSRLPLREVFFRPVSDSAFSGLHVFKP